jgi:hypothetical protein
LTYAPTRCKEHLSQWRPSRNGGVLSATFGFVDPANPHHAFCLNKSFNSLKQAPYAYISQFLEFILSIGFKVSKCDPSLFIFNQGCDMEYLLLYVDNINLTASTTTLLCCIINSFQQEFAMTDLGPLHYFLLPITAPKRNMLLKFRDTPR